MEKTTWRKSNRTDTSFFIMPIFGLGRDVLKGMGFVEAYIEDQDRAYPEDGTIRIFALFKPVTEAQRQSLRKQGERLDADGLVIDDYDYADGYTVLVFVLPEQLKPDYKLFLEGKYSKYSRETKNLFPDREIKVRDGVRIEDLTLQYHVFNKTPGIQKFWMDEFGLPEDVMEDPDLELWYKPDKERETLNIDRYNSLN